MRARRALSSAVVTVLVAACGSGSDGSGPTNAAPACAEGDQLACTCPDGTPSVHVCKSDGSAFTPCLGCPEVPPPPGAGAAGGAAGAGGVGGAAGAGAGPFVPEAIDLLADTNRSGAIEYDLANEDAGEDVWDAAHGAVFIANIDDDQGSCPKFGDDYSLPACHDAADEIVNGPEDVADLAPLVVRPWPQAPEGATGRFEVGEPGASRVRVFRVGPGGPAAVDLRATTLSTSDLRAGVDLALEGRDIIRDPSWDGLAEVTLVVTDAGGAELGRDVVRLRMSPVMTYHHLMSAETIHVSGGSSGLSAAFAGAIRDAASQAGVPGGVQEIPTDDQWTQDFFEPAFMSMPAPGGGQHVVRVYYRSANTRSPAPLLRASGQVVFSVFRGRDAGGIQHYDPARGPHDDTLDSMGNTETVPPFEHGGQSFPLGRLLRGSVPSFSPDAAFSGMLEAQRIQPPIYINTSWLEVGHVDETLSFVRANTPRGWVALVNDPRLARQMFEQASQAGNGQVTMFAGVWSAERTIDDVLNDPDVMSASAAAAAEVDGQLATLIAETGLSESEIIRVPFLHTRTYGRSIAYQPGTVNGVYLADGHFAAPDPHGPVIGGVDIMKAQFEQALGAVGVAVHFIEDWELYHAQDGEVHCGTNTTRTVPQDTKWWESGR